MQTTLFSNVNSAIRRDVWERFPFADDLFIAEDQDWARRVLLEGYTLRYEPAAAVRHSHTYTVANAYRRFFDTGASADRGFLAGGTKSSSVLRKEALRYAREELAWLAGRSATLDSVHGALRVREVRRPPARRAPSPSSVMAQAPLVPVPRVLGQRGRGRGFRKSDGRRTEVRGSVRPGIGPAVMVNHCLVRVASTR